MFKSYKFRIYPTNDQKIIFEKSFGCSRFIYNWGLNKKVEFYTKEKKSISTHQLMKDLVDLKKENVWLGEINSQVLQQSLWNLDVAFKSFFKKTSGFPTFKSKHKSKLSFNVPQNLKIDFKKSTISIPKIKDGIKIKIHRNIENFQTINSGTISKSSSGKYYVSMMIELKDIEKKKSGDLIGIDFGCKTFMTFSNGEKIERVDFIYKIENKIKTIQRKLSNKIMGSKNREKLKIKLSKLHEKVSFRRNDFLHKTTKLIAENQNYNFVGIEDLNIKGMSKLRSISKRLQDLSWSKTTAMLNYKLENVGKSLIKIGRFEPSSKLCSDCGKINKNLTLSDRTWQCSCGKEHDRDLNAAINIKNFSRILLGNIGREPSEFKPLEKLTNGNQVKKISKLDSMNEEKFKGESFDSTLKPTRSLAGR